MQAGDEGAVSPASYVLGRPRGTDGLRAGDPGPVPAARITSPRPTADAPPTRTHVRVRPRPERVVPPPASEPGALRPPAACRLPPAACRLPPAACRLPPAGAHAPARGAVAARCNERSRTPPFSLCRRCHARLRQRGEQYRAEEGCPSPDRPTRAALRTVRRPGGLDVLGLRSHAPQPAPVPRAAGRRTEHRRRLHRRHQPIAAPTSQPGPGVMVRDRNQPQPEHPVPSHAATVRSEGRRREPL
ncbi:hypothetical protein SO3561_10270 [Streptomyces olivochromogenes]|uniref:Uncharacterized protein n=1 Tax=Streptomyces olivochromogenes TaxID=1963 RepID=A0A286PGL6_STROL|nr:hypothetical protein SO3561_10270 [Streptomyces olivochromogenes]